MRQRPDNSLAISDFLRAPRSPMTVDEWRNLAQPLPWPLSRIGWNAVAVVGLAVISWAALAVPVALLFD